MDPAHQNAPEPRIDPAAFIARWQDSGGAERANAQPFLNDLADVLGVPRPDPATGDRLRDGFVFERPLAFQDGTQGKGFIDLYKRGAFVLETKQGADTKRTASGRKLRQGHGIRGSRAWESTMDAARNQAEGYARNLEAAEPPPPFLVVCDVGHCFDLFADFSGNGRLYRPFPDAGSNRILLARLEDPETRALLATLWTDPLGLDPARRQARVTVALARALAGLARELDGATDADGRPMDAEAVAGFLSRSLFCMFAEDAGLIPEHAFTRLLGAYADDLGHLPLALGNFFDTMDRGGFVGEVRARLRRFNGALFRNTRVPRLSAEAHRRLSDAAHAGWADVEPSIFGTLLEQALDPAERHRLGAHFTPRAYVERLVGPAVLEPLRDEWEGVRTAAEQLLERAEDARDKAQRTRLRNEARRALAGFLTRLAAVRVLDPACGSGNFLYVTFAGLKALEDEARRVSERLVGEAVGEGFGVTPPQMRGLELGARAASIADLVLWIGYLQWHRRRYGDAQPLPEPVLEGYGQVAHRDAVLGPDGSPADWPEAEFIVGNPPFIGAGRMREALGDDYTEALRKAYPAVPESADLVMYWWDRAAQAVRDGRARRFGFITTNSITQTFNRRVVERHLNAPPASPPHRFAQATKKRSPSSEGDRRAGGDRAGDQSAAGGAGPLALAFAVPDHPWVDGADGADVRVAMTVGARAADFDPEAGRLAVVVDETPGESYAEVELDETTGRIHADLTVGANVSGAEPLKANAGLSNRGIALIGQGFVVTPEEAEALGLGRVEGLEKHVRPYFNGRDITQSPRGVLVIDLFGLTADEVRERFPEVYEHVLREVKPERDKNRRATYRDNWWIHGETRASFRPALAGLPRYIITSMTAKHRVFVFIDGTALPDQGLIAIALDDAFHLGVLSSRVHVEWARVAGGTLEDRPRYNNSKTFEPFPFPDAAPAQQDELRALGEAIDAHRKARQAAHPGLTLTALYNAVAALRAGREPAGRDAEAAGQGLAHTLLDLHRRLDRAVLDAYGWPDLDAEARAFPSAVLERLVALNRARREEEEAGRVRYLRPAFQAPGATVQGGLALPASAAVRAEPEAPRRPWPDTFAGRIAAVRQAAEAGAVTVEALLARFEGASREAVVEALDALADRGLVAGGAEG